ncbi:hypothetical protein N8718_01495 [Luminiphilus sp.]|nr:hypothetical protein [Luminiphilus sp.]
MKNVLYSALLTTLPLLFIADFAESRCMWGDCQATVSNWSSDGFEFTSDWRNGRPAGYGFTFMEDYKGGPAICEGELDGFAFSKRGVERCLKTTEPWWEFYRSGDETFGVNRRGEFLDLDAPAGSGQIGEPKVNVNKILSDFRAARNRGNREVIGLLPVPMLFLPFSTSTIERDYASQYPNFAKAKSSPREVMSDNSAFCIRGDCNNGYGVLDKLNNKMASRFINSEANGYAVWVNPNGMVCETMLVRDKATGIQRCTISTEDLSDGIAYIAWVDGKKSHTFITDTEGKIITRMPIPPSKFRRADIDVQAMWKQAKRNRDSASDFVLAELPERLKPFPEVWFPSERAKASKPSKPKVASTPPKPKSAPKPKPVKKAKVAKAAPPARCVEGNCVNGFGTLKVGGSEFIGKFTDGKLFGYGLVMTDEVYCEAYLINTKFDGLAHCFLPATNHHVFRKMKGKLNNGPQIIISSAGDITSFDMYVDGEKIDGYFGSTSNKRRRQSMELRNFQTGLSNLRRGAPEQIANWVPSQLRTIPNLEVAGFKSMPPLNRERMTREVDPSNPNVIKTLPAPASRSSNRNGGVLSGANYETTELGQLALIASELNGNRRQVNPNYRLERVRIEPNEFELHFEFITPRDVSGLNKSLLRSSNRTAYCKSSKLEPFRTQNMPARYRFTDPNNEEINFLIKASEC